VSVSRLTTLAVAASLLAFGSAHAQDPAIEAALDADEINQEHCANLYTAQVNQAASATVAVAEAWQNVDEVYSETGAAYLLYWRGVLAQCLGREESAATDLSEFVESQGDSTMFASLVKQAKTRLRRLGGGASLGQGAAASYLRLGPSLEIDVSWSGGTGVHELACTDADSRTENLVCVGSAKAAPAARAALVPVAAQLGIDGFFTRGFGIGARAYLDWAAPSGLPDDRSPGATLQVHVGPQMRILTSVASGARAGWLRGDVRFAASFTQMSPMAGSAKYALSRHNGFLDAGSYALRHVGAAARVEGAIEIGPGVALVFNGRFAWYAPMPGDSSPQVVEPSPVELTEEDEAEETHTEEVEILPDLVRTSQMSAGGRVGILLPTKSRTIAIGPFVGVDFMRATMDYPNNAEDCWEWGTGADICDNEDSPYRKVFSTRRHDLFVTIGIDARFGIPPKQ
jgi:hypothetical protein